MDKTLKALLHWGREALVGTYSTAPVLDAERLLLAVMEDEGLIKNDLYLYPEKVLTHSLKYVDSIKRCAQGEPIASILGHQGFWDLELLVSKDTLIPRPETEILIETILEKRKNKIESVLDLGTGTGAIALALAKERPSWSITATDIHPETLEMAQKNAKLNHLDRVVFKLDRWFEAVPESHFSIIVSNPPYIAEDDKHLEHPALSFEPRRALVSGKKGLDDIAIIVQQAPFYLENLGFLIIEHGFDQKAAVQMLFKQVGFVEIETKQDLAGLDRVTFGIWRN